MPSLNLQPENQLPQDKHWANSTQEEMPQVVETLAKSYWSSLQERGTIDLWRKAYRTYYCLDITGKYKDGAYVLYDGVNGELSQIKVNQYASLLKAILAQVTAARPAFFAKAINSNSKSLLEAPVATSLIETYYDEKGLEELVKQNVETALVMAEAYMHLQWDTGAGELVDDGNGNKIRQGDIIPHSLTPLNVIHDTKTQDKDLTWAIIVHRSNVWDLVAKYPTFQEQILAERGNPQYPTLFDNDWVSSDTSYPDASPDEVTYYCVYHKPTDAVPEGRYAIVIGQTCVYFGPGVLEKEIPVVPLVPTKAIGTGIGHSQTWDLLVLQEIYNSTYSTISSLHDAFSLQNVYTPKGSDIKPIDVGGGLKHIEYTPNPAAPNNGMPTALNLLNPPAEIYKLPEDLVQVMQTISGVGSVVRGEPQSQLKSGTALALMQSLSNQFNSTLQSSLVFHNERIATVILKMIKKWGSSDLKVQIAGRNAMKYLSQVGPSDIEDIQQVSVELANAFMSQPAGRMELAQMLLEKGLIPDGEQVIQFLNTGNLAPLTESVTAELDTIAIENDLLSDGVMPVISELDDHQKHIIEHKALLDPETRRDPAKVKLIEAHCKEHYMLWQQTPQDMAALLQWKAMPPPPLMSQGGSPSPGGEALPPPNNTQGAGNMPTGEPPGNPGSLGPGLPSLPKLPEGSPANLPPGALPEGT